MSRLFQDDNSDSDLELKTSSEYSKTYNTWRQKEEFHKLNMKYKDDVEESSSSDDDEEVEVNEQFEQDFFKTLSYLKNKDPRIYSKDFGCFENTVQDTKNNFKEKKIKETPLYIKDYERQQLLEKDGQLSDDGENEQDDNRGPTYTEEQSLLKENLKNALKDVGEESDDENWGGIFKSRDKTSEEIAKEDDDYKLWLAGQKEHLESQNDESELKPLKDYWADPKLDVKEKFLRDYILNNRFKESENSDYIPTYDEIVHDSDGLSEDEKTLDNQEQFEHKYNFRYEEPDQDFIKRYPRTMEHSLRQKDEKRKLKRAERKSRKDVEKQNKMEEIKQLKAFKRQEIEEKIKKLQEVTGNNELGFDINDLDDDFNPEDHDKRMQELFNNEFYNVPEGDAKPEFPELDEELEIEKWDDWRGNTKNENENDLQETHPHCEDEDFNMDCDYDPESHRSELINNSKKKKKHRRKSKFAKLVSDPKPVYNPENKTYQQYLDEYYQLDCEDVIGDIPCRFKYRTVVPNDFGLSVEEILMAKDKELNRWSSLKKAVQYRPEHVEKYDVIAFRKKAQNEYLKRKFIPSLFDSTEDDVAPRPTASESATNNINQKSKAETSTTNKSSRTSEEEHLKDNLEEHDLVKLEKKKTKKKKRAIAQDEDKESDQNGEKLVDDPKVETVNVKTKKSKKRKAEELEQTKVINIEEQSHKVASVNNITKIKKKRQDTKKSKVDIGITDARLEAYGINPKKYKNKVKYGHKNKVH